MGRANFMAGSIADYHKQDNPLAQDYKGIVVDNEDPLKLRRVRCIVEGLYEVTSKGYKSLPWCMPGSENGSSGSRTGLGSFQVPAKNSVVGVYFPTGDLYAPYYKSWADDNVDTSSQLLFGNGYPFTEGSITQDGSWVRRNTQAGSSDQPHDKGYSELYLALVKAFIHVDGTGNVILRLPKNLVIQIQENLFIKTVNGSAYVEGAKDIVLNALNAIGIQSATTIGMQSSGDTSIESSTLYENSGVVYNTVSSNKSAADTQIEDLVNYGESLDKLSNQLKQADQVAQSGLSTFASALVGTKSK